MIKVLFIMLLFTVLSYVGMSLIRSSTQDARVITWKRDNRGILRITIAYHPWLFWCRRVEVLRLDQDGYGWVVWPSLRQLSPSMQRWLTRAESTINSGGLHELKDRD